MIKRYRHIIVFVLLFSYLFLGFAGTLVTLTYATFGINPNHITKPANAPAPAAKVYWTQHKHIPSTIKISVPSPVIITHPEEQRVYSYGIVISIFESVTLTDPFLYSCPSRSPPQA
ncbi:MAG: hypothetical protein JXA06_12930 [Bacteroidetes bacterium]|nr:hypothetical protein [Bacteroidota bacterium]